MSWWQGLIVGFLLGSYVTFALLAYAFSRMNVQPVVAEWVIAAALAAIGIILFALSWG